MAYLGVEMEIDASSSIPPSSKFALIQFYHLSNIRAMPLRLSKV